jgi:phosphate-selective porin OprO and OprP
MNGVCFGTVALPHRNGAKSGNSPNRLSIGRIRSNEESMASKFRTIGIVALAGALISLPAQGQTNSAEAPDSATQKQIQELREKVEELDQQIRVAERSRELEKEAAAAKTQDAASVTASRDGFSIKSAKGDFQLKVGGYIHADGRFYPSDPGNLGVDSFVLRRVQPQFQGTLYKFVEFRLIPDFGEGKAALQDAYLDIRYFPKVSVRAGKFKGPFGLERLQSATDLLFIERGLPTGLVPNRDVGLEVWGDILGNRLTYAAAVMNGTPNGSSVDGDTNDGKDYLARLFATPFVNLRAGHPLKGLGFGLAGSTGKQEGVLPTFKSAGQLAFFSFGSGVTAGGTRARYSPQAFYYFDRFGVIAEYVRSDQKVRKGTAVTNVGAKSWQVAASYFLTGESKGFKNGAPRADFNPVKKGWGAWEIVARVEGLTIDPAVYSLGLADVTKAARRAQAWGAGLNWYLNKNLRFELNYEETRFTGGAVGGDRLRERTLFDRFQLVF